MRIDTCRDPQWVGFWVYRWVFVSNNRVRAAATIAYCATDMIVKVSYR